ncbi:MAG: 50S ribosomal protein L22 [Planctomycetaceae bacterium]|jgi:large subunit ribosomal protein L22|nr:50S ribosomal protein L22 [Planctomycetaceae bacterium]
MAYVAKHKYARISARKVRPFATLIRGEKAGDALNILRYHPNRGARMLEKVLKSAIANAVDRRALNTDLTVIDVRVDGAKIERRWRAKARGSSMIILKRKSHITVELD